MDANTNHQFIHYCSTVFLWFLIGSLGTACEAAEPPPKKDPEAVYVVVDRARLYAGPSTDLYPTAEAKRGALLEVHHRTDNGWLGVRPPQGSFSWLPASQAYLLPGGRVIEITDANAVSWIGTELGSAKQYRWQVQLNVGEQLSVLGEATINNGADERPALWYRIAPPAGEFRWIEQTAVSAMAPVNTAHPVEEFRGKLADAQSLESDDKSASSVVQTASAAEPKQQTVEPEKGSLGESKRVAHAASQPSRSISARANRQAASAQTPLRKSNEWDGWYAFEMSEQGVKTPFLDKLSGRDRGQATLSPKPSLVKSDPLIHDPFSLAMTGEVVPPAAEEMMGAMRKQRAWRDPKSLRDARTSQLPKRSSSSLAARNLPAESGQIEDQRRHFASNVSVNGNLPTGDLATADVATAELAIGLTANPEVNRASFERAVPTNVPGASKVNWYGLAANPTHLSAPSNVSNLVSNMVVTNTTDVAELQLALNTLVATSQGPWNLEPLAEHARYLIEHGPSAVDRGQARLLLERIEAFQNVSARSQPYANLNPVQAVGFNAMLDPPSMSAPQYSASTTSVPTSDLNGNPSFDATGWLVPVHAAGPDQPTHALTNDTGDIAAYVSPIAGLNLDRYRNQAVGITGLRGYLPKLQAAHIQAQRVSRIR